MDAQLSVNRKFKRMFVNIFSIFVILAMAFPASRMALAEEQAPIIKISTSNDYLRADNFTPNAVVTFTVYATQGSSDVVLEISRQADESGHVFIDGWEHSANLTVGNYVVANDGANEKQLLLEPLTIEVFDPATDLVTGTASPGRTVWVVVGNNTIGYPAGLSVTADMDGMWTADFAQVYDFTDDMWGSAEVADEDWDVTVYHKGPPPPPPTPWLIAFPENDAVEGWEWPEGATVTLTIDNAPGLSWSGVANVTTWGDPRTYVRIEFGNDYDLQIGDQVTLIDEFGTTTTHTVQNLSVTGVNMAEDKVTGTANPGTPLQVWVHEYGTSTLDIIAGEDGTWLADFTNVYDIAFNTGGRSQIVVEGNSTAVDWNAPPPPMIAVSLTINWISLNTFLPDAPVTLSIYESQGASTAVAELSRTTDAYGNVFIQPWEYNWDVKPGNYVVATDGVTTKELVLENLTLDVFDPDLDLVSGQAVPGRKVDVGVGNADGEQWMTVFADETTGVWTADFTTVGFDITADMWAGGHVNDEDGDVTAAHNSGAPNPHFTVFPEWEWFDGWNWFDGTNVTITVAGKPECETVKESWGGFFNGSFGAGCDLVIGDTVTFTDGATTRTHTVQNLAIKSVNEKNDTIKGIADPGTQVYVWPHATGQQQVATTDAEGIWKVSFAGVFDLVRGESGRSEIRDEFENATAVDWYVPNPRFTVFPEWEWFDGMDWADGAKVTITVAGKPECKVRKTSWDFFFNGSFGEGCNVVAGDTVTFKSGMATRTHVVQNLAITAVDAEADIIAGTADAGAVVNVWPHATGQQLQATADSAGVWQVDFTEVFDLVPGECGRSQINDAVGNATAVDWCVPWPPRLVVQITDDWFRAENFAPNTALNFWIYSAQGGDLLLNGTTEPTDEGGTITHWVGDQMDLLPGNYLVVSDGTATKELVLEGFTFDILDLSKGILQGTAPEPFGRTVSVGIGCWQRDDMFMNTTTNETGAWTADFGVPIPNDYGCVYAWVYDTDGDVSEIRPSPRMLTTGNFYIAWSQNNPEEVPYLSWKGSGNLTNPWEHPNCQGDLEFFGNSWVTETDIFWASLVGWGTTGDWSQVDSTINIQSTSSGCPGSADFPINTQYQFFDAKPDLIMVQRTLEFGDTFYAHDVRPFIPRLYPSDGFTQVYHPNASGDELVVEGTCDFGCIAESWDGTWFAIHNPATGLGMIVQRVDSAYSEALWLDDDDGSFTNATSFLLLQPDGGFTGTVTETEYLCFYDSATWTPSLTLPDGCQP